jgi:hypothetical protein
MQALLALLLLLHAGPAGSGRHWQRRLWQSSGAAPAP